MIISKKQIAVIWELKFSETFKNLEIYLNLTDWLHQYIFYYVQLIESLQNKKTALFYKNFTTEKSQKNILKKHELMNNELNWWNYLSSEFYMWDDD